MLQIAQEIVYFAHINSNHIMKIINFAETNSILNQYVAEMYKYKATAFASAETLNASGKLWPMK